MSAPISAAIVAALPTFSAETEESFTEWVEKYNLQITGFGLTATHAMRLLPMKLESAAFRAYKSLDLSRINDYQTLLDALAKKIYSKNASISAKVKLHETQREKETLADFASRIRNLTTTAHPELRSHEKELLMIEIFVRGISQRLQRKLLRDNFDKLDEALSSAQAHDTLPSAENDLEKRLDTMIEALLNSKIDDLTKVLNKAEISEKINIIYDREKQHERRRYEREREKQIQAKDENDQREYTGYQRGQSSYDEPQYGRNQEFCRTRNQNKNEFWGQRQPMAEDFKQYPQNDYVQFTDQPMTDSSQFSEAENSSNFNLSDSDDLMYY